MVVQIFGTIGDVIEAFSGVIGVGFTSLISLFYADNALTMLGILALIGAGTGLVYWAFGLVRSLINVR